MTVFIEEVSAKYESIKVLLETTEGQKFYMRVKDTGLEFYRADNSAGSLLGKPVVLSPDQIFNIVGGEGEKVPFRDRVERIKGIKKL